MAGFVLKREPVEAPVILAVTAHPKLEVGIDEDGDQSDAGAILMSVKQEMSVHDEEMDDNDEEMDDNEVCLILSSDPS